jgi:Polyketide cyclase / dehydrase and lipid transport
MSKIERSIVIDRPVNEVWEFVQDTTKDAMWQTTLVESQLLTEGPRRVGTQVQEVRRFLGVRIPMTLELTEFEPERKSSLKAVTGGIPLSGSYLLEPLDDGTKLTVTGQLEAHRLFKLAEPVFARMTIRELEASLGHLKDLLEVA